MPGGHTLRDIKRLQAQLLRAVSQLGDLNIPVAVVLYVENKVARDKARGDPFRVTGAIPGLIQRCQNGSEVTVVRGPSPPRIYRLSLRESKILPEWGILPFSLE